MFIVGDAKGRELDLARLGPQDRDPAKAIIEASIPVVDALSDEGSPATPAAVEAFKEQLNAALSATPGIDGDQAIDLARKTSGNAVITLVRSAYDRIRSEPGFAWKEYRAGVYRAVGTATVAVSSVPIVQFIAQNAEAIKTFVEQMFHNPTLIQIVDIIAKLASHL